MTWTCTWPLAGGTGGPIPELAVGSGRLAVPLAEAGHQVTGVDLDPAMLERAGRRAAAAGVADRLALVAADLVDLRLPEAGRFGLAFIALNSLLVLATRAAQRAAFHTLAAHLRPGGVAVADVWLPDAEDRPVDGRIIRTALDPETGAIAPSRCDPGTTPPMTDLADQFREGGQGPRRRWTSAIAPAAVRGGCASSPDAGLIVEVVAGDYHLGLLGPGSERAIVVAAKP